MPSTPKWVEQRRTNSTHFGVDVTIRINNTAFHTVLFTFHPFGVFLYSSNAFDSDYTWDYKLEVSETDFKSISEQIERSKFYNPEGSHNFGEAIYDSLKIYKLKGYWVTGKNMYIFYPTKEEWTESTYIEIDKSKRTIKVNLVHL